jgi:hypothetical protein
VFIECSPSQPRNGQKGGERLPRKAAKKFGDHIAGDYLIAKSEPEAGIDDDRVAMVIKECSNGFSLCVPGWTPRCIQYCTCNEALRR